MANQLTLEKFYQESVLFLKEASIDSATTDARLIILKTLGLSDVDFITDAHTRIISDLEIVSVKKNLETRVKNIPVSRIFDEREFWGMSFKIGEACLDPRPDTETLVEAVVSSFRDRINDELRFIDFGTGSGCIIISILTEFPNSTGVAVDISPSALKIAKENARRLGVLDRINFVCSDWNSAIHLKNENKFDVLLSNPPYIDSEEIPFLDKDVQVSDPILALDGGFGGLNSYSILIEQLNFILKKSGRAFFEIGIGQETGLERLIEDTDANLSRLYRDIAGIVRVVDISCGDK